MYVYVCVNMHTYIYHDYIICTTPSRAAPRSATAPGAGAGGRIPIYSIY